MTADPIRWRCKGCQGWFGVAQAREVRGGEWRCAGCAASGRTDVDEPSELDRLRERAERAERWAALWKAYARRKRTGMRNLWLVYSGTRDRALAAQAALMEARAENARLRTALAAAANALDAACSALSDALDCDFDDCDDAACPAYLAGLAEIQARAALGEGRP